MPEVSAARDNFLIKAVQLRSGQRDQVTGVVEGITAVFARPWTINLNRIQRNTPEWKPVTSRQAKSGRLVIGNCGAFIQRFLHCLAASGACLPPTQR